MRNKYFSLPLHSLRGEGVSASEIRILGRQGLRKKRRKFSPRLLRREKHFLPLHPLRGRRPRGFPERKVEQAETDRVSEKIERKKVAWGIGNGGFVSTFAARSAGRGKWNRKLFRGYRRQAGVKFFERMGWIGKQHTFIGCAAKNRKTTSERRSELYKIDCLTLL